MKSNHLVNMRLRALEISDIDLIYSWENDASIWEKSNTHIPFSRYVLEQYILSTLQSDIYTLKQLRLMIDVENDGIKISVGCIDLFDFDPFHQRSGIGILIDANQRNKGFATMAIEKICLFCRHHLQLYQLYANVAASNAASIQAFLKNNFFETGRKKDWIRIQDGFEDELLLQKILG